MSNCVFGWPALHLNTPLYEPSFSGGSWSASLPLANLKDTRLSLKARSADALAASTQFDLDTGAAQSVRVLAIVAHNLTPDATVRWIGGSSSGGTQVFDTTAEAVSFAGKTANDRRGVAGDLEWSAVKVLSAAQSARYIGLRVSDTSNPDGYVQLKVWISGGYQPTINMDLGTRHGLDDGTVVSDTDAYSSRYDAKVARRLQDFVLNHNTQSEAYANVWAMQRRLGRSGQLLWVFDAADTTLMHERAFLATMRELNGLEYPHADGRVATAFRLREEI